MNSSTPLAPTPLGLSAPLATAFLIPDADRYFRYTAASPVLRNAETICSFNILVPPASRRILGRHLDHHRSPLVLARKLAPRPLHLLRNPAPARSVRLGGSRLHPHQREPPHARCRRPDRHASGHSGQRQRTQPTRDRHPDRRGPRRHPRPLQRRQQRRSPRTTHHRRHNLSSPQDDDPALIFRLQHIISGAVRYVRPKYAHVVKIDNWFGPRWRCFAGSPNGNDLHPEDRLAIPPFALNRVLSEATYRRQGDTLQRIKPRKLHDTPIRPSSAIPLYLDERCPSGLFVWYSGNSASQDRASLMVYEVEKDDEQRAWYAEFQRRDGTWIVSATVATSLNEVGELETAYANLLAPLVPHADDERRELLRNLWERALDAAYSPDIAQAMVLIDKYRSLKPDDPYIRLLHARNLAGRRLFAEAEEEFRAIERQSNEDQWRTVWLTDWAEFCNQRGDQSASEAAYREHASLAGNETTGWILLGSCLARQGKHDEAEAVLRHATQLPGDPDEAYLNLGYVLRATGRLDEAAAAFEKALELCPDYPEASAALADVLAALALRRDD